MLETFKTIVFHTLTIVNGSISCAESNSPQHNTGNTRAPRPRLAMVEQPLIAAPGARVLCHLRHSNSPYSPLLRACSAHGDPPLLPPPQFHRTNLPPLSSSLPPQHHPPTRSRAHARRKCRPRPLSTSQPVARNPYVPLSCPRFDLPAIRSFDLTIPRFDPISGRRFPSQLREDAKRGTFGRGCRHSSAALDRVTPAVR